MTAPKHMAYSTFCAKTVQVQEHYYKTTKEKTSIIRHVSLSPVVVSAS